MTVAGRQDKGGLTWLLTRWLLKTMGKPWENHGKTH